MNREIDSKQISLKLVLVKLNFLTLLSSNLSGKEDTSKMKTQQNKKSRELATNEFERKVSEKVLKVMIATKAGNFSTFDFNEAAHLINTNDVLGVEVIEVKSKP